MTVRSLLALLRASNASNGAWPFAFRGLATAAASSSVSSPSAALAAAAASSAGAGAASSAGAGAARIGTAVSGARAPSARAAAAPPTAAAAQRADIRRLLLARTEPWPYHEAAVSRHQVQYTPPAVNGAGLPAGSTAAWTASSRRVGVVGLKAGMTADWDKWGVRHALTVIRVRAAVGVQRACGCSARARWDCAAAAAAATAAVQSCCATAKGRRYSPPHLTPPHPTPPHS